MEENSWGINDIKFKESNIDGLKWLRPEELSQIKMLLEHAGLSEALDYPILNQNAAELTYEATDKNAEVILQTVLFNRNTKLEIVSSKELPLFARLYHLKKKDDENVIRLIIIDNHVIKVDKEEPTELLNLDVTNIIESISGDYVAKDIEEVSTQAWYDSLPCVGNGCCVFREPTWPGGPIIPFIYNWCGASCGSGEPINSLDTCCRTHDYCYQSFKTYPNRCSCDQTLINCADQISGSSSLAVRTAFGLKMRQQGC